MSQRQYLRAPVNDEILYICDDYVLKGNCVNISQGGVLLSELGMVPDKTKFSALIPLIQYPEFSKLNSQKVLSLERSSFEVEIIRVQVDIVRSFEGMSDVDKILMKNIGARFSDLASFDETMIQSFVETFAKNLIHLLTLMANLTLGVSLSQ